MRLKVKVLVALTAAVCLGVLATGASAQFRANSVVPLFCTSDTIPAGAEAPDPVGRQELGSDRQVPGTPEVDVDGLRRIGPGDEGAEP
jgi:hypothetical protein